MAYTIKPWEELTIQDDYMFKLVMSRKRICKKMLEKILKIKIHDIKYLEEEKTITATYQSKGVRLDVYVEDEKHTVYNVEMQVRKLTDAALFKRPRYYQSMIDVDLLATGAEYDELNDTYIIFICPFAILDEQRHIYTFRNYCTEDKNILMPDGSTKVFLSTKGNMDDVTPDVKAFLDYVDGIISNDEFVQELDQEIKDVKTIERERRSYMTYEMKMREMRNIGLEEGREEGRKEGRKEGLAEGRAEGRVQGRAEGHAEGRAEAAQEGMQNVIATVRDLNLDKDVAVQQLIKRYSLPQNDAVEFVNNNW